MAKKLKLAPLILSMEEQIKRYNKDQGVVHKAERNIQLKTFPLIRKNVKKKYIYKKKIGEYVS